MKKFLLIAVLFFLPVVAFADNYIVSVLLGDKWEVLVREKIEDKLYREYVNEKVTLIVAEEIPLKKGSVLHVWGKSNTGESCDYLIEIERLIANERYTIFGITGIGSTFDMQILIEGGAK